MAAMRDMWADMGAQRTSRRAVATACQAMPEWLRPATGDMGTFA